MRSPPAGDPVGLLWNDGNTVTLEASMPRTLGIITIGQAPRDDIANLFAQHAPPGTKVDVPLSTLSMP